MRDETFYHDGARSVQDRFGTRRLADRLKEHASRVSLTESDRAFIESRPFFFLATADASGAPEVSYKGGRPGFVKVLSETTLAFPNYDGNGMFRSLGNLLVNARVGLLFLDFEKPRRLRVNGLARLVWEGPLVDAFEGAKAAVEVEARAVFGNCPRYVHRMAIVEFSAFVPEAGRVPPTPDWKLRPEFRDVLPPGDPAREVTR